MDIRVRKPQPYGEKSRLRKLTDAQVAEIRESTGKVSSYVLAERFGVNQSTVWRIMSHVKRKRNPEGTPVKKIRHEIISLARRQNGRFTDRALETLFKNRLHQCLYVLDGLLDDGIVEIQRRPTDIHECVFVYRLASKKPQSPNTPTNSR